MQDKVINDDLKKLIITDGKIEEYFLTSLLHSVYKDKNEEDFKYFYLSDYNSFNSFINSDSSIKASLSDTFKETLSNDMINDVIKDYRDLALNEAKSVLYTLSRVLFFQDKFKDNELGQDIDNIIKECLGYIRDYDKDKTIQIIRDSKDTDTEEYKKATKQFESFMLYKTIQQANNYIYVNYDDNRDFITLFANPLNSDFDLKNNEIRTLIRNYLVQLTNDAKGYAKHTDRINSIVNDLILYYNYDDFLDKYDKEIKALKEKYNITDDNLLNEDTFLSFISDDEFLKIPKEEKEKTKVEAFFDELYELSQEYEKKDIKIKIEYNKDVDTWRNKADILIKHIEEYKDKRESDTFDTNYVLTYLAYSDYQKEAYKLKKGIDVQRFANTEEQEKKAKRLSAKELKEKYKESTLLNGENLDYNRKFARLDTSKTNTQVYDLRESIVKKTKNNVEITKGKIATLKKITNPSKEEQQELKRLTDLLGEQQENINKEKQEIDDLKADILLLDKQISELKEEEQIKELKKIKRDKEKVLKDKVNALNSTIIMQPNLLDDKIFIAEKVTRNNEKYRLMVDADYDIQNFNQEGRNFLYYIPNIPNIINQLNEDFITVDINDFLDFTGRPTGNVSRIRKNLQKSLIEMRKETYDYTYYDDKGVLHDDSLVLVADIKGTEYKGKASIKVQLGGTFKGNLKDAFNKNQIVKVNSDVFKIGQGTKNKVETRAREIFTYLSKLSRTEAKKQDTTGVWYKDLHLQVIIKKLCDLNLLTYDTNRYNECVKEPLLYALNTGVELGYFEYKTDAFKYYDDVIATSNNGANVKDKITNFETGKDYGIRFIIKNGMIDLESNAKAHKTYEANKKRYNKKSNK
jgi:hypothetical protein